MSLVLADRDLDCGDGLLTFFFSEFGDRSTDLVLSSADTAIAEAPRKRFATVSSFGVESLFETGVGMPADGGEAGGGITGKSPTAPICSTSVLMASLRPPVSTKLSVSVSAFWGRSPGLSIRRLSINDSVGPEKKPFPRILADVKGSGVCLSTASSRVSASGGLTLHAP